jgi:hypothetical protein
MSRWLKSVNSLLEKLDDRVETVVEERTALEEDELFVGTGGNADVAIEDILARRGLAAEFKDEEEELHHNVKVLQEEEGTVQEFKETTNDDDDDDDDELGESESKPEATNFSEAAPETDKNLPDLQIEEKVIRDETQGPTEAVKEDAEEKSNTNIKVAADKAKTPPEATQTDKNNEREGEGGPPEAKEASTEAVIQGSSLPSKTVQNDKVKAPAATAPPPAPAPNTSSKGAPPPPLQPPKQQKPGPPPPLPPKDYSKATTTKSKKEKELAAEAKEAQKEARTLRRHVVSLNSQLEAAESELQAQRKELERAAEGMEKDRKRAKEEKEASQKLHSQELATIKEQLDLSLKDQQVRFEDQLQTYKQKLALMEDRRKQEGGDWNKEMTQAIEREGGMSKRVTLLE